MAANYNLEIDQGATFEKALRWKVKRRGVDLTGWTARAQFRASIDADAVLIELTTANGRITLDAEGNIGLRIEAIDTAALPVGRCYWDLELVNANYVKRLLEGSVTVKGEVTR